MDQSTPSWRVFDAPAAGSASEDGAPSRQPASPGAALLGAQPLALLGVVGAVAIGVIAIVLALGGAGSGSASGPEVTFEQSGSTAGAEVGGQLVVDVTGAVVSPGLYRLNPGTRVGDAIEAAGGFSPRVDAERVGSELNLAAALSDGAQVRVPSRDDEPMGGSGSPGGGGGGGGGGGAAGGGGLVDLNTATQSELEALPGIGPVTATKIIAARAEAPFQTVEELRERGLVGEKTFESIKSLVTAG